MPREKPGDLGPTMKTAEVQRRAALPPLIMDMA